MSEKTNENNKKENLNNEVKENKVVNNKNTENIEKTTNTDIKSTKIINEEAKNIKNNEKTSKKKEEVVQKSFAREIMEWVVCIVVAFALALCIKYYVFTPTLVMQDSMTPTILDGERVLINRLVRTFNWELNRGDIITLEAPSSSEVANGNIIAVYYDVEGLIESFKYNVLEFGKTSYIKRVIGLPGDKIEIKNGYVYVNGELQEEEYLQPNVKTYIPEGGMPSEFTVPEGYIFAMGDNREHSTDCRLFGCVPIEKVEGRVTIRIWPPEAIGKIDK